MGRDLDWKPGWRGHVPKENMGMGHTVSKLDIGSVLVSAGVLVSRLGVQGREMAFSSSFVPGQVSQGSLLLHRIF